jgi:hypothetical protein
VSGERGSSEEGNHREGVNRTHVVVSYGRVSWYWRKGRLFLLFMISCCGSMVGFVAALLRTRYGGGAIVQLHRVRKKSCIFNE